MINKTVAATSALLLASAGIAFSQGPPSGDPFHARGDRGETVHVLPTPAGAAHSTAKGSPQPLFRNTTPTPTVYPASYGSGNLINHGGLEIASANFVAVYWNSNAATVSGQIANFIQSFGANNGNYSASNSLGDYTIVQQYGSTITNNLPYLGAVIDTSHDNQPTPASLSDSQIQTWLAGLLNTALLNGGPLPTSSSTIYGLYFPSGISITLGSSASCSSFCGYHSVFSYGSTQIKYAVFPYPNCSGCSISGLLPTDMLTIVSSHEIREAVTDPGDFGQNAWYDRVGYEGDDKCVWHNLYKTTSGGFYVQPEYSNGGTISGIFYPGPGCVVP